jgi:hypothetical protein
MQEQAWIQLFNMEFTKEDWETNKFNNETLIKTNLMQIEMAQKIIELCDEKIKDYEIEELANQTMEEENETQEEETQEEAEEE